MSKSLELLDIIDELGRKSPEFDRVFEGVRETIVEHLWKLYAYHTERPRDVNGWLRSLNKHLERLRTFNIPKGKRQGFNRDYDWLEDKFIKEDFEDIRDLEVLAGNWSSHGYPVILVNDQDVQKIHKLADRYIRLILSKSGLFSVSKEELK